MAEQKWVAGWGASVSYTAQSSAEYFKDETFRYVIFPTMDATRIRLHFSNEYGEEPATITKTFVALRTASENVDAATNRQVTFGGKPSLTLAPGETATSDEIDFAVTAGKEFSVSLYFADMTQMRTGHSNGGYYIKKYYAKGDHAADATLPPESFGEGGSYLFLHTIDFLTSPDCAAIIAFGDSITAQPWPDCLAHRLFDLGIRNRAVIRKGIGGGRVLREYNCRFYRHWGVAGIRRFERDVTQSGADRVFVLHGINDIIHPNGARYRPWEELPTAEEMIENGYKKYVEIAHKHGMKIYLSPILPSPRCTEGDGKREAIRVAVNEWIRTNDMADGVIDFESAVWDENDRKRLKPEFDSGDHLHPSLAGATQMANSIPEALLKD